MFCFLSYSNLFVKEHSVTDVRRKDINRARCFLLRRTLLLVRVQPAVYLHCSLILWFQYNTSAHREHDMIDKRSIKYYISWRSYFPGKINDANVGFRFRQLSRLHSACLTAFTDSLGPLTASCNLASNTIRSLLKQSSDVNPF